MWIQQLVVFGETRSFGFWRRRRDLLEFRESRKIIFAFTLTLIPFNFSHFTFFLIFVVLNHSYNRSYHFLYLNTFDMASRAGTLARAAIKSNPTSAFKSATRNSAFTATRQTFRQQSRRGYASEPAKSSSNGLLYAVLGLGAAGGAGYYFYTQSNGSLLSGSASETKGIFTPKFEDYEKVYNDIATLLAEKDEYEDGSYGPVLVRLAWHASGTFDKLTGTGGSNGATMRFAPEGDHGANAGLKTARDFLEPIKGTLPHP